MSAIVKVSQPSHWYHPDGRPCYEVEMASKKGVMRPTTLLDARKRKLLPSVTTVMRILDRPMLNAWRVEQAILAALTLPAIEGELLSDRARRIARDAEQQVEDAAKIGTLCHAAVENFIITGEVTSDPTILPLVTPFMEWWKANCIELFYAEKNIVHPELGYAGRLDCKARIKDIGVAIIDFKTRKPALDGSFRTYDEDSMQLSAYMSADNATATVPATACISILINSQSPGLHVHIWDDEDIFDSMNVSFKVFETWKAIKKYDPTATKP